MSGERQVGVAVIGMGWIGRRHARLAQINPRSRLLWVVDSDSVALETAAPELQSVRQSRDLAAALSDREVNAVVVATPPEMRGEICAAAIPAGKATLIEKPVSVDAGSTRGLVASCRGGTVQVANHARHSWDLVQFREQLRSGAVGVVVSVEVTGALRRPPDPGSWYFDPARGGGVVRESLGHSIDLVRWLLDTEFESVSAEWSLAALEGTTFDHTVAVVARLDCGAVASIVASLGGAPGTGLLQTVRVIGMDGIVDFDFNRRPTRYTTLDSRGVSVSAHPDRVEPPVGALAQQWETFLDAVQGIGLPAPDLEDALATMDVVEAIALAARERRRVPLRPVDPGLAHA